MSIITIDFETYYSQDFSLSKLTTEEYIRDPQFQIIGVAVKVDDNKTRFFSGSHEAIRNQLQGYNWASSMVVAHNAMFDMAILNWILDIRPMAIGDTLSMARAIHGIEVGNSLSKLAQYYKLGEKGTEVVNAKDKRREDFTNEQMRSYAGYCANDVEITYQLFLTLLPHFNKTELRLINLTIRMFTEPSLRLDGVLLNSHLIEVRDSKKALLTQSGANIDDLMSNFKFAELLRELGVEPPMKISATTGKEALAFAKTDEEFKALSEHPDLRVQTLVAARLGNKTTLEETRTERLISIADRGLIPVPLSYYAAHTGRWGGADKLNFQNLPSRGQNANKLKKAILAPAGHVIIDCDSSQIEARVLAWFAGQDDLVKAFAEGEDVYKIMASAIYNKPREEIDKQERFVGKTTILGAGYGMGGAKFQAQLKTFGTSIELKEAERIVDTYRETYPHIKKLWSDGGKAIDAMNKKKTIKWGKEGVITVGAEGIIMPNGLVQRYPNLKKVKDTRDGNTGMQYIYDSRKGVTKLYGGKLTENICQGLARCIIGEQMLRIARKYTVVLTVHDAVACIAPKAEAEEAMAYVMECMRYVPDWAQGIPLNCEAGYGDSYGDC